MELIKIETNKIRILTAFFLTVVLIDSLAQCHAAYELSTNEWNASGIAIFMIGLAVLLKIECHGRMAWLFNMLLILLSAAFGYTLFEIFQTGPFNQIAPIAFLNLACCMLPVAVLYVVTGRLRLAMLISGGFLYLFGLAGYFIKEFRGDTLLYMDFMSTKTAMQVVSGYHFEMSGQIIVASFVFAALILWALKANKKMTDKYQSRKMRLAVFALSMVAVGVFMKTDVEKYYYTWEQEQPLNGYPYLFCVNIKVMNVEPPSGYSAAEIETYMQKEPVGEDTLMVKNRSKMPQAEPSSVQQSDVQVKPNIIAIMNESFSDPRVVGDFQTNMDYMPYIHNMSENTIKGNLYTSVFGGGTCDSEYSFLTGNTTAYLPQNARPYQLYIKSPTPGLAATLNAQGYNSIAMHPGERTAWNRDNVYPELGFSQFLSREDFEGSKALRGYVSDEGTYDKIINLYENKGEDPLFVFDVTIQNHGGYDGDLTGLEPVRLEEMENDYPGTEQYLSLMRNSDAAFGYLVEYFKTQEAPTLIVMFGDHQATIEQEFYEELMGGKPLEHWTLEELQRRYATPFVIWANYDIEEKNIDKLSINYLQSLLLEQTGLEQTAYNEYLMELSETLPVINTNGTIGANGEYYRRGEESPYSEQLLEYKRILYNGTFDVEQRRNDLFYIHTDQ